MYGEKLELQYLNMISLCPTTINLSLVKLLVVFTIWNFLFQCFKSVMLYSIYAMMFNGMPIRRHYHLLIISMPTSETALQNLEDRVYTLNKGMYHFILDTLLKILYISIDEYSRNCVIINSMFYCLTNTRKYIYN